jgi:hypothetical protein
MRSQNRQFDSGFAISLCNRQGDPLFEYSTPATHSNSSDYFSDTCTDQASREFSVYSTGNREYEVPLSNCLSELLSLNEVSSYESNSDEYEVRREGWPLESFTGEQAVQQSRSQIEPSPDPCSSTIVKPVPKTASPHPRPSPSASAIQLDEDSVIADIQSILAGSKSDSPKTRPPTTNAPRAASGTENSLADRLDPKLANSATAEEGVESEFKNEHEIFDRLARSMKFANAYDLGRIGLEQRFDQFDLESEQEENWTSAAQGHDSQRSQPEPVSSARSMEDVALAKTAGQQDFVEDLDLILAPSSRTQSEDIPLDPGVGGRSIGQDSLQPGDIILSTTDGAISSVIRGTTGSPVSHASIYVGDGQLVESIGAGTLRHSLTTALDDDSLAVAYRHRDISSESAAQVVEFLNEQVGNNQGYDHWGIIRVAPGQLARTVCQLFSEQRREACLAQADRIRVGTDNENRFYCSELILAALQKAGLNITETDPSWSSPDQLIELYHNGLFEYVGHLKA